MLHSLETSKALIRRSLCATLCAVAGGCGGVAYEGDFQVARQKADQRQSDLFVYYKSWLLPECGTMQKTLNRGAVRAQLSGMVCCVLDDTFMPNREFMSRYHMTRVPALLVIRPDGQFHVREGVATAEEISAFLAVARSPAPEPKQTPTKSAAAPGDSATPATTPPTDTQPSEPVVSAPPSANRTPITWYVDFQTANDRARRANRPMVIFYDSEIGGDDGTLLGALQGPELAGLLGRTVNCKLDWSQPTNRARMAHYDVTMVPGFVVLKPDSRYASHHGPLTPEELRDFLQQHLSEN